MFQTATDSCLRERGISCQRCVDTCPGGAIDKAIIPQKDPDQCHDCGLCSLTCPVGVFLQGEIQRRLLHALFLLPNPTRLLLICPHAENKIPTGHDAAIILETCPLTLDLSILCSLRYWEVKQVGWLTGDCSSCGTVDKSGPVRELVDCLQGLMPDLYERDTQEQNHSTKNRKLPLVIDPQKLPFARRKLLGVIKRQVSRQTFPSSLLKDVAAVRELVDLPDTGEGSPLFFRCLFLAATSTEEGEGQTPLPKHFPIHKLTVDGQCWACGACARACPSQALAFSQQGDHYTLSFRNFLCLGCGLCTKVCRPQILHSQTKSIILDDLRQIPIVLSEGLMYTCKRCQAGFAPASDCELCPICRRGRSCSQ